MNDIRQGIMNFQVKNLLPYHFVHHIIHTDRHGQIKNAIK